MNHFLSRNEIFNVERELAVPVRPSEMIKFRRAGAVPAHQNLVSILQSEPAVPVLQKYSDELFFERERVPVPPFGMIRSASFQFSV